MDTIYSIADSSDLPDHVEIRGQLRVLPRTKIGYLPQSVQIAFTGSVEEYLDSCSGEVSRVFNHYNELTELMSAQSPNEKTLDEYGEVMNRMNDLDAWDLPRQKTMILEGLGLSSEFLGRDMKEVSGGEATKVALAGVLVSLPNLILMDEPSNNLDPKSLFFLEEWIKSSTASLLVVSHDRQFLDSVIDEIIEIDEATKGVIKFGGNYTFYAGKKQEMFEAQVRQFEDQTRKRKQLEEDAERLRREAQKFETTSKDAFYRAKGASLAKRASNQLDRIERDLRSIPEPIPPRKPRITVFPTEAGQELLLGASNISFTFPELERRVLESVNFDVHGSDRVGIIGPNGVGKTTFLRILLGEIEPNNGSVSLGRQTRVSYLPQTSFLNNPKQSVIEFLRQKVSIREDQARTLLGRVLFTDPSSMSVGNFSFGELRRIELIGIFASQPNLIILDEPTNHLDVYTIEMLEEALRNYKGAVVTVSHDQRFLVNMGVNKLAILDGTGEVRIQKVNFPSELADIFQETFK
ncbi:ABC-F family ATP-binding cassette domain-containing protein [Candidatus Microgenomates bacterium]|nr:ABC-F family ATP-binding cassette domain-containing protein [Candidatus Microgenomates bacterium]